MSKAEEQETGQSFASIILYACVHFIGKTYAYQFLSNILRRNQHHLWLTLHLRYVCSLSMCGECILSDHDDICLKPVLTRRGLKYVSRHRQERIRAIAEYICTPDDGRDRASSSSTSSNTSSVPGTDNGEATPLHPQYRSGDANNSSSAKGKQREAVMTGRGSRWDIVCLQELWCSEDWEYILARARESGSGLVHGRYFYRLVPCSLLLRSRI